MGLRGPSHENGQPKVEPGAGVETPLSVALAALTDISKTPLGHTFPMAPYQMRERADAALRTISQAAEGSQAMITASTTMDIGGPVAPEAATSSEDLLKDVLSAPVQPGWHVERLQAFADLVARMTTDEEMDGEMMGDDAVMTLGELIASARGLAVPPPALEVKKQRAHLVEVVTAMLAEEKDLRFRDNEHRSRRGWYGCTEGFSVTAACEVLGLVKANPVPAPPEALDQRDRLLKATKKMLPDMERLLSRYNASRERDGLSPLDEPSCLSEARELVRRVENGTSVGI